MAGRKETASEKMRLNERVSEAKRESLGKVKSTDEVKWASTAL